MWCCGAEEVCHRELIARVGHAGPLDGTRWAVVSAQPAQLLRWPSGVPRVPMAPSDRQPLLSRLSGHMRQMTNAHFPGIATGSVTHTGNVPNSPPSQPPHMAGPHHIPLICADKISSSGQTVGICRCVLVWRL